MPFYGPWGIFVHIPKCGGDMVKTHLQDRYGMDVGMNLKGVHCNGRGLKGEKFTVIRDPLLWIRSYHTYMGLNRWKWVGFPPNMFEMLGGQRGDSFPRFVEWCGERPGIVGRFFEYYTDDDDMTVYTLEGDALFKYLGVRNYVIHETKFKPGIEGWMEEMIRESEREVYEKYYSKEKRDERAPD